MFLEPVYPVINYWTQVTVNSVKICWIPPNEDESSFDYFRVDVKRLRRSDNFVAYEKEEFARDFSKGRFQRWFEYKSIALIF